MDKLKVKLSEVFINKTGLVAVIVRHKGGEFEVKIPGKGSMITDNLKDCLEYLRCYGMERAYKEAK